MSHQLPGEVKWPGNTALARAARPEPATKGHSQSGLIREPSGAAGRDWCCGQGLAGASRAAHNRALVVGGAAWGLGFLHGNGASFLPYNLGADGETD